ncbi:MAG TPA: DUF4411 family protein [Longimicrobium sp.]|nr:DUF4411 family protein [Longimicrobium sp.]
MLYVFDTNSIRVLGNYYPERFPSFWQRFEELVADSSVVSVREVLNELHRQSVAQWLQNWVDEHRDIFLTPGAEETEFVREIFGIPHFRNLIGEMQRLRGYPVADPFIIACAKFRNGCVVTEEGFKQHTNMEGFLSRSGWQF